LVDLEVGTEGKEVVEMKLVIKGIAAEVLESNHLKATPPWGLSYQGLLDFDYHSS